MRDIFSKAEHTIVYLGEPEDPKEVPAMFDLGQKVIDMTRKVRPKKLSEDDLVEIGRPSISHASWKLLANAFCLPYWGRVWIVQELVLAHDVMVLYGDCWKELNFWVAINRTFSNNDDSYHLEELMRPLVAQPSQVGSFWNNDATDRWLGISHKLSMMDYYRTMRQKNINFQKWALQMVTRRSTATEATDPRDYIFGMLGILPEEAVAHQYLQPDYNASCETAFTNLARFMLESQGLPSLLTSVGFPRQAISRPSWVPDWSTQKLPTTVHRQAMLSIPHQYGRDEDAPWHLEPCNNPRRLYVQGVFLDSIAQIESILC